MTRANASTNRSGRSSGHKVPRRKGLLGSAFARYEQLKAAWNSANPAATPEQYDAAMVRIARMSGV